MKPGSASSRAMRCEPLRFPAGEGPFRARGLIFRGFVDYVEGRVPGGMAAIRARVSAPGFAAFFDRIFLASAHYDLSPLVQLVHEAARAEGTAIDRFVRERSRKSAEIDGRGVYRAVLPTTGTREMAPRLPRMFERYFEGTTAALREVNDGSLSVEFSGLPAPMLGMYAWSTEGFVGRSLELAGAVAPRFAWRPAETRGRARGVAIVTIGLDVSWSTR